VICSETPVVTHQSTWGGFKCIGGSDKVNRQ